MSSTRPDHALDGQVVARCREVLERNSKSFSFAARLLAPVKRDLAAVVYAWCRYVDDAIDEVPDAARPAALARLQSELPFLFDGAPLPGGTSSHPPPSSADERLTLDAFRVVASRTAMPRLYAEELIAGMAMDVEGVPYPDDATLLHYCHRVAGVVGLMMCHVFGVRHPRALRPAAHMGWAMQLTNICRDVLEDWDRGRLYLPDTRLSRAGAPNLRARLGAPFPDDATEPVATVVRDLLALADAYYRSGDRGLEAIDGPSAIAVAVAREVYSGIGGRIAAQDYDVRRGRAFVPLSGKVRRAGTALRRLAMAAPVRWVARRLDGAGFVAPSAPMTFEALLAGE